MQTTLIHYLRIFSKTRLVILYSVILHSITVSIEDIEETDADGRLYIIRFVII
jgi:hypothetical protein